MHGLSDLVIFCLNLSQIAELVIKKKSNLFAYFLSHFGVKVLVWGPRFLQYNLEWSYTEMNDFLISQIIEL